MQAKPPAAGLGDQHIFHPGVDKALLWIEFGG